MRADPEHLSSFDQRRLIEEWSEAKPRVLPADWVAKEEFLQASWYSSHDGLRVLLAVELVDRDIWLHASFSRADQVPSWFDTKRVKEVFFGPDRKAISVLPRESEYYNLAKNCLHLYAGPGADALPDFRNEQGAL